MSAFSANMVCHLWDLWDQGVDKVLDLLQGELGATGISIPVLCPPVVTMRTWVDASPRVFRTQGGALFTPDKQHYAATRCLPPASDWKHPRGALEDVVNGCRSRGLACRFVVHVGSAGLMNKKHEHVAAKNSFGDAFPHRICPVNPDVQAFVVAVCGDLVSQYEPDSLELADLHVGLMRDPVEADAFTGLRSAGQSLLNMCFCESCRQLDVPGMNDEGLDAEAAARSVIVRINRIMKNDAENQNMLADVWATDVAIRAHLSAQWQSLGRLVASVHNQGCDDVVYRCPLGPVEPDAASPPWKQWCEKGWISSLAICAMSASEQDVKLGADQAIASGAAEVRLEIQINALPNHFGRGDEQNRGLLAAVASDDGAGLVRSLAGLSEVGIAGVHINHYGQLPAGIFPSIKHAVRFARRTPA